MPYYQLYYHLVWSTKNREPLLTPQVESNRSAPAVRLELKFKANTQSPLKTD